MSDRISNYISLAEREIRDQGIFTEDQIGALTTMLWEIKSAILEAIKEAKAP